jgi:hypothetical protein
VGRTAVSMRVVLGKVRTSNVRNRYKGRKGFSSLFLFNA